MNLKRGFLVSLVFLVISIGVGVWLYPRLPAQVPTHWNLHGQVNDHLPRFWAAAMWPLMIVVFAGLTWLLPVISPRQFAIKPFVGIWGILTLVAQGFVLVIGVAILLAGAGYAVSIPMIVMFAVGVLYMLLGNYLGKLRRNFFIGIRTPWTLASDAVWERTHRFGGWVFMLGGLLMMIAAVIDPTPWLLLILTLAILLITAGYSYFIHLRLEGSR
ncbi:MAG TPA: SdpI family protein [Rhodanobacter sp.]|nr:SdpI family protein [Rhodanobacter sp.]